MLPVTVAAGTFHSGGIDTEGYAYLWGANYEGQLCSGATVNINFPTRIVSMPTDEKGVVIEGVRWVQLALGSEHSILLASSGQVYACGSNRVKQLGRPRFRADTGEGLESSCLAAKTPEGCPTEYHLRSSRPVLVLGSDQSLERVVKVVSGSFHLLALTADGNVFAWGDNRMNQLGQGPGVNRGSGCCATKVPMYIDNAAADEEYAHEWAWAGYKVLDIEAGAHFSIALVMNITGLGCTADGQQTNNKCVKVNPDNGLMEQDWDVPRNIDIIANHFRKDAFDFAKSTTCNCNAKLHLPGGLANCKDNTFAALYPLGDGRCYEPNMNVTVPCRYSFKHEPNINVTVPCRYSFKTADIVRCRRTAPAIAIQAIEVR
ncbi:regulator of chromosome condensation 1/beta-lactamase-inhibitor protein II [Baffinella frigidus]|nr:regulator of chromosome condensation 1/beta-lactamase-inhibitor protein II [Cryptophyta sp. CCMP2293]